MAAHAASVCIVVWLLSVVSVHSSHTQRESSSRALLQTSNPGSGTACSCIAIYKPVCGTDGKTYGNACELNCTGPKDVGVDHQGECASPESSSGSCICTFNYDPVCGQDRQTYPNNCSLECKGVQFAYNGECKPDSKSIPCPPKAAHVNCFADPCRLRTCKAYPQAQCWANYCGKVTFLGKKLNAPCGAVFVVDNRIVDCNKS